MKRNADSGNGTGKTPLTPEFTWFHITADVNDPLCLCSVCLKPITVPEEEEFDEYAPAHPDWCPLRLFAPNGYGAVFHHACIPASVLASMKVRTECACGGTKQ